MLKVQVQEEEEWDSFASATGETMAKEDMLTQFCTLCPISAEIRRSERIQKIAERREEAKVMAAEERIRLRDQRKEDEAPEKEQRERRKEREDVFEEAVDRTLED